MTGKRTGGPSLLLGLPAVVLFAGFALIPMVLVAALTLFEWDGLGTPTFVGFDNWQRFASDSVLRQALWLSVKVMVVNWLIQTPVSLLLGVFLAGRQRYREILAVVYFVPLLLSSAAISVMFRAMLDPNLGLLSSFAAIPGLGWITDWNLGNTDLALYIIIGVISWMFMPFHTLIYQAGARQIPQSMYDAASIDGASRVQQFFHITLPQLKYTIVTSTTLILIGSLTYFEVVFIMTGGGPGFATRILPLHMYLEGFAAYDMGYASTIALTLVLFGLALSGLLIRFSGFGRMTSQQEGG